MADSYTTSLRLVQQVNGENDGTWGDKIDAALQMLEDSVADVRSITLSSTSLTLSSNDNSDDQARAMVLDFSGTPGGTTTVTVPDVDKVYVVVNGTTDSSDIIMTNGNTTHTTPNGVTEMVYSEGGVGIFEVNGSIGKHTMWIPAEIMRPTVSNGCAVLASVETTAGRPDMNVLDFDATSDEHAQFSVAFPKEWDEGTITYQVFWTSTGADTDGVSWGLQGVSVADNATIDVAYGTAIVVDDALLSAAEDMMVSVESGAVTISGAAVDTVTFFRIFRDVSDTNDTATEDARLIGVKLFYTTNAGTSG